VKKVKLKINPITTPIGRNFPVFVSLILDVRMIGSMGNIQGDSIVTIPAINENIRRRIISI